MVVKDHREVEHHRCWLVSAIDGCRLTTRQDQALGLVSRNGRVEIDELVPVILGAVLGAIVWRGTTGQIRLTLSVLAVIASGAFATVLSGEYLASWVYILLDLGEAALGLVVGFAVAHRFLPAGRAGARSSVNR